MYVINGVFLNGNKKFNNFIFCLKDILLINSINIKWDVIN